MPFTLFNNLNNVPLKHPQIGLWYSEDREEAEDMLRACYEYLDAVRLSGLKDKIEIREFENEVEVSVSA